MTPNDFSAMKWAFKIVAKLLMARLPVPYAFWKSVGVFRRGRMDSADYSFKIFKLHLQRAYPEGPPPQLVVLELGPGDSVASAVVGCGYGVKRTYLVDVENIAIKDIDFYRSVASKMSGQGLNAPDLSGAASFEEVLHICNAEYWTNGNSSLRQIPTGSIDFVWSHSVLEHVRKNELETMLQELKRVLKPGALSSHNIDYQDHLDGALNNLRFSDQVWESALFSESGFYTNRIPAVTMHRMFKTAGFEIRQEGFGKWPALPTPRKNMHADYRSYRDADLMNRTSHVLLQAGPKAGA
jgi:SAM-dependent methyltransferase